jgi:hypothetical protein
LQPVTEKPQEEGTTERRFTVLSFPTKETEIQERKQA